MTRHVILGGAGFTGARLVRDLVAEGKRPLVFDAAPQPAGLSHSVDWVTGDVTQAREIEALGLGPDDVVYHLAARQFHGAVPARDQQTWFNAVNVQGVRTVIAAMKRGGARRLIFFSTDMTYGVPQGSPIDESHPQSPIGPYGASKLVAEQALLAAVEAGDLQATIFRPRLIAGAGRLGVLAKLFALIRLNAPVPMIGDGTNRYQMVAVEDCVRAARLAVEKACPTGPFNLGSTSPPTVRTLLQSVIDRAGSRSILIPTPAAAVQATLALLNAVSLPLLHPEQFKIANETYVLDTTRAEEALGWTATRSDEDILWDAFRSAQVAPDPG